MPRDHISTEVERRVRDAARHRCGYCLSPQRLVMARLFRWSADGILVIGISPSGRATVALLHLADDPDALIVRAHWVLAGWHPPSDN